MKDYRFSRAYVLWRIARHKVLKQTADRMGKQRQSDAVPQSERTVEERLDGR
jgi:hypothetical protein